jgi:hypothetical protein
LQTGGTLFISLEALATGGSQNSTNSGPGFDSQVAVTGNISLAGNLEGTLLDGFTANIGDLFFIIINQGTNPIDGTFAGNPATVTFTGPGGQRIFSVGYNGNASANTFTGGNDVVLEVIGVPEPGSAAIVLAGLGLVAARASAGQKRGWKKMEKN